MRRVLALARVELVLTLRRGESLIAVLGIPLGMLLFFSAVDVLPHEARRPVDFLVPGMLALAVVSSGMVSLGIATGFERQAGVLKRLGATPLGRRGLLAAKALAVLAVEAAQAALIVGAALAIGWRPDASVVWAAVAFAVGTAAFCGIGFALAGRLKAETNLAVANGLFGFLLLTGGIVIPLGHLPGPLRAVASVLPAAPLSSSLRATLDGGPPPAGDVAALAAWAVCACAVAAATFRWE